VGRVVAVLTITVTVGAKNVVFFALVAVIDRLSHNRVFIAGIAAVPIICVSATA